MQSEVAHWIEEVEISDWDVGKRESAELLVHRPGGSGDWLFLYFHTPVIARGYGELRAGTCLLFSPRSPQWYRGIKDQGFSNDYAHFQTTHFPFWTPDKPFFISNGGLVSERLAAMAREITRREIRWREGAALQLALLFIELGRLYPSLGESNKIQGDERLANLRSQIYARPQDKWTLETMGRRVHLSSSRLSVLYKATFGTSPMDDVLAARTQKARTLLLNQVSSIECVARECGFESAAYFSRQFKRREGSAPREWVQRRLER